jgi:lipopolysaccharide transport system permease protein
MSKITIYEPRKSPFDLRLHELVNYKELFVTLLQRDIKIRYKQTIVGSLWAILQPFLTMVVFSFFFGKIAKIPSDGVPYPIFSYSGLLLWTYFASAVNQASNSLIANGALITKVYFPRLIIPLSSTMVGLVDYLTAGIILALMMIYFKYTPNLNIIFLPLIVFTTWMLASGIGFWLSAMNVLYRDVRYVLSFILQLWIFATPVIYPLSVAERFRWIIILNPMTGIIEAHRAVILGKQTIDWGIFLIAFFITTFIFVGGLFFFKSIERRFADVI